MGNCVSGSPSSSANATTEELPVCHYEVFLSFRGPDVRRNFLDCFYDHLTSSGIVAFRDREEIKPSERINTKILKAIRHSDICVPVFSDDFASSAACLMEVAQMVELGKPILPIFYGVKPSVVKHQKGKYGRAFIKHGKLRDPETIRKWKNALENIAEILGFEVEHVDSGYHELLKNVVSRLRILLKTDEQDVTESLVGIDRDVPEMMRKLGVDYQEEQVRGLRTMESCMVAILGLPGVGKTTLAKVVYNKISHLFHSCSFLEDVKDEIEQNRMVYLQKKLIRDLKGGDCPKVESYSEGTKLLKGLFKAKRVLIVLDNVDNFEQIKLLAGKGYFGPGSRIILTIREKDVIGHYDVPEIREHEVLPMNENHALKLFYKHAFRSDHPVEDYGSLPSNITFAVGKLPLAIEIVGSYLYKKSEAIWRETLQNLERELDTKVERVLTASYNLLRRTTREVFLDIACFFTGVEKTIPYYMWDARERLPNRGVDELQRMSFLKIGEGNEFLLHEQLKVLGRAIVKNENLANPGLRSRLWDYEDVQTTLRQRQVTSNVEALRVTPNFNQDEPAINCFHWDDFRHLSNVRFLELDNVEIEGNPKNLLPSLVWLDWHGCHEKSKLFALNMEKLVILGLCSSEVQLSLEDWRELMLKAKLLKVLNAKDCPLIIASLEFSDPVPLECLVLENCLLGDLTNHGSTSGLVNLISLNMKRCSYFRCLPEALCSLKKLEELLLDGTKIERLEFKEGSLPALKILSACECEDLVDVDSITFLKKLQKLTLRSCKKLKELPSVIGELVQLKEMDLSDTLITELPPSVRDLENLEVLKVIRTYLEGFPEAVTDLNKLKELDFTYCGSLSGVCNITRLSSLRILRLKYTRISCVHAKDCGQFNILELDDGVEAHSLMETLLSTKCHSSCDVKLCD